MSAAVIATNLFARIKLPVQDLDRLSFCPSNRPRDVARWAEALPATRVNQTSVILYKAMPEIARLRNIKPTKRLAMLESLRPYVQRCIEGLSQTFLNKPVVLPEDAMKAAIVALALQKHISNGYCVIAREIACDPNLNDGDPNNRNLHSMALALHRTISGLGEQLMRSYQLYASTAAGLWISLHHLYRIAKTTGIDQFPVSDELMTHVQQNSCRDAYHRVLLLACANPNKMRQYDVSTVYKLVELWSSHLRLRASEADSDAVFAVNLEQDRPPTPRALIPSSELSNYTDIDLSRLLSALDKQLDGDNEGKSILPIPKGITAPLLSHLINAWGTEYHRAYERVSHKQELQVLVGVSAIHFHLCDGIPFDTFVLGSGKMNLDKDNNPYLHQRHKPEVQIDDDPWSNAFDAEGSGRNFDPLLFSTLDIEKQLVKREREQAAKKFPIQTVQTEDRSHKGYCLHWRKNVPKTLKSGELIALREPDAEHWTLGLVRWVRQNRGSSRLGVELVSAMARPYGASIIHKSGDDVDYLRAFYLPEQKPERPTPCLLTPSVPFQEGQKVRLTQRGQQKTAQLMRKTMETAAISVFAFRPLEGS